LQVTASSIFITFVKRFKQRVIRKFFQLDKNYLLENTQLSLQHVLLSALLKKVKKTFELQHNPLLLEDDYFLKIRNHAGDNFSRLHIFYHTLAGVYRYKFGENQLEILWSGQDHPEKYEKEWTEAFDHWTTIFCQNEQFLKAVLDLTVFHSPNIPAQMAENRMNYIILHYFELKIHKNHGFVDVKVA
jgi:hypothetical protein